MVILDSASAAITLGTTCDRLDSYAEPVAEKTEVKSKTDSVTVRYGSTSPQLYHLPDPVTQMQKASVVKLVICISHHLALQHPPMGNICHVSWSTHIGVDARLSGLSKVATILKRAERAESTIFWRRVYKVCKLHNQNSGTCILQ